MARRRCNGLRLLTVQAAPTGVGAACTVNTLFALGSTLGVAYSYSLRTYFWQRPSS